MRTYPAYLALAVLTLFSIPACTPYPFRGEAAFQGTADAQGVSRILVETRNGAIRIRCVPEAGQVDVRANRFAGGVSPQDARAYAEKIRIVIQRNVAEPAQLDIRAEFPGLLPRNEGAAFEVTLPPGPSLCLRTHNGEVAVTAAAADVDVTTSNGGVEAKGVRGSLLVRTSNGRIHAEDVEGDADLNTSNGPIDLNRVGRGLVRAETHNGRIRATGIRGNVILRSTNGNIRFHVASAPQKPDIQAMTSNGSVEAELPRAISARLQARTSNGSVSASLGDLPVKDVAAARQSLTATLGDGVGSVQMESSNGSITIRVPAADG